MRNKRTKVDFSKHVHRVEIFKNEDNNEIRIDHFQIGDSNQKYIQFINTDKILSITGDYGNWIFSRPFIPNKDEYVSGGYWLEKLNILSTQEGKEYDSEKTKLAIQNLIDSELEELYEDKELEICKEWFTDLLEYTDDELEYTCFAYKTSDKPPFIDYETIPFVEEINIWLQIIFDAFDEICYRIEQKELTNV